ncbi:asparaginase [Streptomyces sp. NPDC056672]|uniref:asparaginase n=1 Tax=Streptomyces sp. NPDC056672 TaxID=3345906 RepID=UPI0036BB0AF3
MVPTSQVPGPTVLVISLGGTIAMTSTSGAAGGVAPRLTAADLVAAVPGLEGEGALELKDFRQIPGAWLEVDAVAALAELLNRYSASGTGGFVITQGTDTLEETAYLLDLLYEGAAPVVITGAMRNPTMAGADGPANLLAAVRTASSPAARNLGVLVVFADEIHAARHIQKIHSTSISAFASPGSGPIGHVVESRPRLHFSLNRQPAVAQSFTRPATVEVIETTLGSSGVLLHGAEEHLDGLVIAAFGAGHVPASWTDRLEKLAARIPVVLTSRTGSGSVLTSTYVFAGSETHLLGCGLINGGTLDPRKARLLLIALLRAEADRAEISAAFAARN